ncbi:MAG: PEP-CTERM/exosortase system-associated acyltransferase [Deltaproteobacteria bacterium]|nr:PEP-CTERM/exosortase system-associated acyltransferase [Deltaproteobacteria bacterium]
MKDLTEEFEKRFEVVHVTTPELRRELFQLRYQVFCCQMELPGFEPWRYPSGEETDVYDARSVHCVLRHRPTNGIAGAVRLVLADAEDPNALFPLESYCTRYAGFCPTALDGVPRERVAEISRLFVARQFGGATPGGAAQGGANRGAATDLFPYPILGLLKAVFEMSARNAVTHLYAIMEPQLNRLLRVLRLSFNPVGPAFECHGWRQPHLGVIRQVLAKTRRERPRAWEVLTGGAELPAEEGAAGPDFVSGEEGTPCAGTAAG